jgi:hypothetical protein
MHVTHNFSLPKIYVKCNAALMSIYSGLFGAARIIASAHLIDTTCMFSELTDSTKNL